MSRHLLHGDMETRRVWLDGKELLPDRSQRIRNHSPDGFCWGYGGSGPAQLALAVLLEIAPDEETALREYQTFKRELIATLAEDFEVAFSWPREEKGVVDG